MGPTLPESVEGSAGTGRDELARQRVTSAGSVTGDNALPEPVEGSTPEPRTHGTTGHFGRLSDRGPQKGGGSVFGVKWIAGGGLSM